MFDYILTAMVPLLLAIAAIWGNKKNGDGSEFMSKDYTQVLKACCCIIVIMVHFSPELGNKMQDAIGSFAYVCVTFFFLFSVYGMNLSVHRKPTYLKNFWRNRLAALLIPCLLINLSSYAYSAAYENGGKVSQLFFLNPYVSVLLQYCLLFWFVQFGRKFYSEKTANILLVAGVVTSSLLLYFLTYGKESVSAESGWCFERWGLVWGIIILAFFQAVKKWVTPTPKKIIAFCTICMLLGVAYLKYKHVYFFGEYLLKVVLGVAIIAFVFILTSKRTLGNKSIFYLGSISYEVYLSHGFMMGVVHHALPDLPSGVYVVAVVIATIIFSAIIHALDKPLVKWCRAR